MVWNERSGVNGPDCCDNGSSDIESSFLKKTFLMSECLDKRISDIRLRFCRSERPFFFFFPSFFMSEFYCILFLYQLSTWNSEAGRGMSVCILTVEGRPRIALPADGCPVWLILGSCAFLGNCGRHKCQTLYEILLIKLYPFIQFSVTLIAFQCHSSVKHL